MITKKIKKKSFPVQSLELYSLIYLSFFNAPIFLTFPDLAAIQVDVVPLFGTLHHQSTALKEIMYIILVPGTEYMLNKW